MDICVSCQAAWPIILLKNCIVRIFIQNCIKLLNNIVVYLYSYCVSKKMFPLQVCDSSLTKCQFFGDVTTLLEKCEGSPNSKHDNFVHLYSHLNGTRFHSWKREYWTKKNHCMCSNNAADETLLFLVNQLAVKSGTRDASNHVV